MTNHRHLWKPTRAQATRVQVECYCGKKAWRSATICASCKARAIESRAAGGSYLDVLKVGCAGCFKGMVIDRWKSACCCSRLSYDERCRGCKGASDLAEKVGHDQVHVCMVASEDEIEHELALAFMAPAPKVTPDRERDKRAAGMEERSRN